MEEIVSSYKADGATLHSKGELNMKTQIRGKAAISFMVLSLMIILAVSGPASYSKDGDLNLTYIGEAVGPNEKLTYFLQGPEDGEVVVLLPGMGRGASEFRELAAALNEVGYRTVAIQPRGIGRSGPILTDPSYDQFAEDIEIVLKDMPGEIAGGKVHVLGYEFGNRIARMFAVKYPERTRSLLLLACGGQEVSSSDSDTNTSKTTQSDNAEPKSSSAPTQKASDDKDLTDTPSAITETIDSFFQDLAVQTAESDPQHIDLSGMIGVFAFWFTSSEREPYVKKAFFAPTSQVPFSWITGWYRDTGWMQAALDLDHSSSSADWVSGGNAPMLILNGDNDKAAPVSNAEYMKKTYPDRVTMAVVQNAGHAMLAEQPEFIIDQVISYLEQHQIVSKKNTQ